MRSLKACRSLTIIVAVSFLIGCGGQGDKEKAKPEASSDKTKNKPKDAPKVDAQKTQNATPAKAVGQGPKPFDRVAHEKKLLAFKDNPLKETMDKCLTKKDALACEFLGVSYQLLWRKEKKKQYAELFTGSFERACKYGSESGCVQFGIRLRQMGDTSDRPIKLFKRACQAGHGEACLQLAELYYKGIGTFRDEARAMSLLREACRLGHKKTCLNLAGQTFANKKATPQELAKAFQSMAKACDKNHLRACHVVGKALFDGRGTSKDKDKAFQILSKNCDAKLAESCTFIGKKMGFQSGAKYLFRACELNHKEGCKSFVLAQGRENVFNASKNKGSKRKPLDERYKWAVWKGCDLGVAHCCELLKVAPTLFGKVNPYKSRRPSKKRR